MLESAQFVHRVPPLPMSRGGNDRMHRAKASSKLQLGLLAGRAPVDMRRQQAGKLLVPLLGVLTVLAMGVAAAAVYLQLQEREKRQAKEKELHLALAENDDLKSRVDEIQQQKSKVEGDLTNVRTELTQLQTDLAKAVKAQETLTQSIYDREKEIARLTKELDSARGDAKQATTKLAELKAQHEEAQRQLSDLGRAKSELESKVMELSSQPTVELDKVTVGSNAVPTSGAVMPVSVSAEPSTNGQVVVINRDYDFIVMNLGKNHGLLIGQEFQVVRGAEILGKVKVEKVYDELSAATILPDSKKDIIREGDTVRAL